MAPSSKKPPSPKALRALAFWHGVTLAALDRLPVDLSARQTAVMLTVYLQPAPHSIKSLAEGLAISKPAVCRAVDALEEENLIRRMPDKHDGRNVLLRRTAKGAAYLDAFADILLTVSKEAG